MRNLCRNGALVLLSIAAVGCGQDPASSGPFGPPRSSALMTPFAGRWAFEAEKTLNAQKAAGASDEQIAEDRKVYAANPELVGQICPDLTFDGNVAVGAGLVSSEYRFFDMHKHGTKICGKAWHHEDRFDPGDMSKCYVRLEIVDGCLHMDVNMTEGLPDLNDPDLASEPPVEGDAAKCAVGSQAAKKPGDWVTYVFSRPH
jgi:hypothetical protein